MDQTTRGRSKEWSFATVIGKIAAHIWLWEGLVHMVLVRLGYEEDKYRHHHEVSMTLLVLLVPFLRGPCGPAPPVCGVVNAH